MLSVFNIPAQRQRMMKYLPTFNSEKPIIKAQQKHKRSAVMRHHHATRPRLLICQSCCWLQRFQGLFGLCCISTQVMATVATETAIRTMQEDSNNAKHAFKLSVYRTYIYSVFPFI